jgi:hypothetical protein
VGARRPEKTIFKKGREFVNLDWPPVRSVFDRSPVPIGVSRVSLGALARGDTEEVG